MKVKAYLFSVALRVGETDGRKSTDIETDNEGGEVANVLEVEVSCTRADKEYASLLVDDDKADIRMENR